MLKLVKNFSKYYTGTGLGSAAPSQGAPVDERARTPVRLLSLPSTTTSAPPLPRPAAPAPHPGNTRT